MKKNLVKITESDLRRIVENSVRRIIKEDDYDDYDFDNNYDNEYEDDDEYNDFDSMSVDDKWSEAVERVGAEAVLNELEQWLSSDTKEKFLNDFYRLILNN